MDRLRRLLRDIVKQGPASRSTGHLHLTSVELTEDGVLFSFSNERKQHIEISQKGERYRLMSVVLKQREVEKLKRDWLLPLVWQRNRETNLVSFSLDNKNRLVGAIEQPLESVDADELIHYLERLARECDQLEYVLSGMEDG